MLFYSRKAVYALISLAAITNLAMGFVITHFEKGYASVFESEYLPVGTIDGRGPFSLRTLNTRPLGAAYVYNGERPDLFIFERGKGLFLARWVGSGEDGEPVFDAPIRVWTPHDVISGMSTQEIGKGGVFQTDDGTIHGIWLNGKTIMHTIFYRESLRFYGVSSQEIVGVSKDPDSIAVQYEDNGAIRVFLEISSLPYEVEADMNPSSKSYAPYNSSGIWQGWYPLSDLYVGFAANTSEPVSGLNKVIGHDDAVLMYMQHLSPIRLSESRKPSGLVTGSHLGNLYYFSCEENLRQESRQGACLLEARLIVDKSGVALRHPTVLATPIAYWNPDSGYCDLIVGGEGALYYYRFTGDFTVNGNPVYEKPIPVLLQAQTGSSKSADLYGGSLVVPNVVDWNGDGVLDIIAGNSEGRLLFFENKGTNEYPRFMPGVSVKAGGKEVHIQAGYRGSIQGISEARWGYTAPTVVDWTGNGLPDIVMGDITGSYSVYINRGTLQSPELECPQPIYHKGLNLH
ncbi:MAG: VCBS repeat-containing protein, partial [Limnochordia bacterium]|nr:VCBS repeat-containing protein [Limnochordia bacterium]